MRHRRLFACIAGISLALGSVSAAAAQVDEPATPEVFGARLDCLSEGGAGDLMPEPTSWRDRVEDLDFEMVDVSDPRLEGDVTFERSRHDVETASPGGFIASGRLRIDGADGAWEGTFLEIGLPQDSASLLLSPNAIALVGEGAYAGLTAVTETRDYPFGCGWLLRGLIVKGEVAIADSP